MTDHGIKPDQDDRPMIMMYDDGDSDDSSSDYDETIVDIEDDDFSLISEEKQDDEDEDDNEDEVVVNVIDPADIQNMLIESPTSTVVDMKYLKHKLINSTTTARIPAPSSSPPSQRHQISTTNSTTLSSSSSSSGSGKKLGIQDTNLTSSLFLLPPLPKSPTHIQSQIHTNLSSDSTSTNPNKDHIISSSSSSLSEDDSSNSNGPYHRKTNNNTATTNSTSDSMYNITNTRNNNPSLKSPPKDPNNNNNNTLHPPPPNNAPELEYDVKSIGSRTGSLHRLLPSTRSFKNTVFPFASSSHHKMNSNTSVTSSTTTATATAGTSLSSNLSYGIDKDHLNLVLHATQHHRDRYGDISHLSISTNNNNNTASNNNTNNNPTGNVSNNINNINNPLYMNNLNINGNLNINSNTNNPNITNTIKHQYAIESADTIHRRNSSLFSIYEAQLNMLYQNTRQPDFVIRVLMRSETRYRICCADNPQGDETDNWATIIATFEQNFLIHGDSLGVPVSLDRVVSIEFDKDLRRSMI